MIIRSLYIKERKTKIDNGYTIKQYIILMCVYTYILNNTGCHHNMIVVHKKGGKTKIDNGYTIKQYVILTCVYTYILNEWDTV